MMSLTFTQEHTKLRNMWDAVTHLWNNAADSAVKWRLALTLALVIFGSGTSALSPIALKLIVDGYSVPRSGTPVDRTVLILAYALIGYAHNSSSIVRATTFLRASQRLRHNVSRFTFAHIMNIPLSCHEEKKPGELEETIEQGIFGCETILRCLIFTLLPVGVAVLTAAVVLVHANHAVYLGLFSLMAVAYGITVHRSTKTIVEQSPALISAQIDSRAVLADGVRNYEAIKCFGAETVTSAQYDNALTRVEKIWSDQSRRIMDGDLSMATVFAACLCVSLVLAGRDVTRGAMTVGDFVLINSYAFMVVAPMEHVGLAVREVAKAISLVQRLLGLLREQPEPAAPVDEIVEPNKILCGELFFDHVSFSYHPDRPILKDLTFRIRPGTTVAIVGMSGSGKSSLIRLMFRLREVGSGSITLDGVPISSMPLSTLRKQIAVVPQDTALFNNTIGYNIRFGRWQSTQKEIEDAAKAAHLHEFVMGLPQKYDTVVGERGLRLSGGERQRVLIARALLKRAVIYLFDEATSSLDSKTERQIVANLKEIARRSTVLVIAHRLATVLDADEIIVIEDGVIAEMGSHHSLLLHNGRYAALWWAQQHPSQHTRRSSEGAEVHALNGGAVLDASSIRADLEPGELRSSGSMV